MSIYNLDSLISIMSGTVQTEASAGVGASAAGGGETTVGVTSTEVREGLRVNQ